MHYVRLRVGSFAPIWALCRTAIYTTVFWQEKKRKEKTRKTSAPGVIYLGTEPRMLGRMAGFLRVLTVHSWKPGSNILSCVLTSECADRVCAISWLSFLGNKEWDYLSRDSGSMMGTLAVHGKILYGCLIDERDAVPRAA